tara:strand:+ start:2593 stop:3339 length:747 start_codon:yes stop_codon:yes gene_type:complete
MQPYEVSMEQIKFYNKTGYLHLKNVFPREDIDIVRQDMDEYATKNDRFTIYLDMHHYKNLRLVHRGKRMCDIADALVGGHRAIPIGSTAFFCKPNNSNLEHGSTWHQDNYAGRSTPGSYLNVALAIDDADSTNGSLMVVPGSHQLGDLPCNPKANFSYDLDNKLVCSAPIGNNCELPKDLPIVQLEYNAGDVLAVHGLLVHKAEPNKHLSRWRRTMYNVYVKEYEPFWPGWTSKRRLLERYDSPDYQG